MPPTEAPRTLGGILNAAAGFLATRKVQEPRLAAEWLAARLLRCRRLDLHLQHEKLLSEPQIDAMRRGVKRVAAGEPVQYVVGSWEFRGHSLLVDSRALIPRPETEELVQQVLDSPVVRTVAEPRIVDVGTGTGCIAISLAKELPRARILATDVSPEALELASLNARRSGVSERIRFAPGDLADLLDPATLDVVVSNPPYIPSAAVDRLAPSVRAFEPRLALDGGEDGMQVLRQIAEEAALALRNGGGLFLELSAEQRQAEPMARYLQELGFEAIQARRDMSGAERFLVATLAEGV